MFLRCNILRNLTTALEFHKLKWLLIYDSKHGKYWNFEFLGTFLIRSTDSLSKIALFFDKYTKSSKIGARGAVPP